MGNAANAMAAAIDAIVADRRLSAGIAAMTERRSEFSDTRAMTLSGIGVVPDARRELDDALSTYWAANNAIPLSRTVGEIVIGSGVHAAIYCATRVRSGYAMPLVLERSDRPGGTFAMSVAPSFYLNSGNRPGLVGLPNKGQALNYLPGAPMQPADISLGEYQTNADIAFVTRATLAQYANVVQGAAVKSWSTTDPFSSYPIEVTLTDDVRIYTQRVIDARGLGNPNTLADSPRVQTFPQFAATLDGNFPMRGMRRVAVVGGGDSGKVAVEALLGIGPSSGMSTAALDYVDTIDWYGNVESDCEGWLRNQRKRYARIGSYLGTGRLNVTTTGRANVIPSFESALVNSQSYDRVITATGYTLPVVGPRFSSYFPDRYPVALKSDDAEVYTIGPAANLPFTQREENERIADRPENRVAIFRYAPRTAALATMLPDTTNA